MASIDVSLKPLDCNELRSMRSAADGCAQTDAKAVPGEVASQARDRVAEARGSGPGRPFGARGERLVPVAEEAGVLEGRAGEFERAAVRIGSGADVGRASTCHSAAKSTARSNRRFVELRLRGADSDSHLTAPEANEVSFISRRSWQRVAPDEAGERRRPPARASAGQVAKQTG